MRVHILISALFAAIIMVFKAVNDRSVIDAIYVIASYTYGPLLGLFAFGLFTRLRPADSAVPYICLASPLICYALERLTLHYTGYRFGYEMLMINGALTFLGLWIASVKALKNGGNDAHTHVGA